MKLTQKLSNSKKTLFSIEILPPLKGRSIQSIFDGIDPLMEFKPAFVDVTYHREEYIYKKREGGYLEKVSIRKRPGTVGICAAIMNKYNVEAVPHIICGGFTREETENALIDLQFLGIDNVLALRGDSIKTEAAFIPEPGGHHFGLDLVKQIVEMNKANYLDDEMKNAEPTDFCIGIAGYPEKHFEAPNMTSDLKYLKAKVDAGAEYIVTQMFFDNKKYFEFVNSCRAAGITIPIIPGLKPITNKKQMNILPRTFHVDLPSEFTAEINKCKTDADVELVGTEWLLQQSRELKAAHVPVLHYYTLGKPKVICDVVKEIV